MTECKNLPNVGFFSFEHKQNIHNLAKDIYNKKCDVNVNELKNISIMTIQEINNLDTNINKNKIFNITNIIFVCIFNILLIILIFKLYS